MIDNKKKLKSIKLIFIALGFLMLAISGGLFVKNYFIIHYKNVTYGEAVSANKCGKSFIRPCYYPKILYEVQNTEYKISGKRIYKEKSEILSKKYRVIYNKKKPSKAKHVEDESINYLSFYSLPLYLFALGALYFLSGLFGKSRKKTKTND